MGIMMSSRLKKRARSWEEAGEEYQEAGSGTESEDDDESSGEEGEEDSCSSDFDPEMEVKVQFEVCPIECEHRPAIRRLLQQLLLKGGVDVFGITELLLSQDGIGSVIQIDSEICDGDDCESDDKERGRERGEGSNADDDGEKEDEEVCGVMSVINLTHHQSNAAVKSLTECLLTESEKHSPPSLHSQLCQLLARRPVESASGGHVGLLVNERYLNIPPHVTPPLLKTLLAEVKEASGKGLPYDFDSFLLMARSYVLPSPLSSPPHSKRRRWGEEEEREAGREEEEEEEQGEQCSKEGAGRENGAVLTPSDCVLHCQEYEILQEEATLTFSYPVSGEGGRGDRVFGGGWEVDDQSLQQTRTVMVVPASRLQSALQKLTSILTVL